MKALEGIGGLKASATSFRPWIYTIARNAVIDHYRTHRQHAHIDDVWDLAGDEDIARDADLKSALNNVQKYLQQLDAVQRDIVLLRVWQGMSYAEIAAIVGKSPDNCKVIFSRVVRKMRADLAMLLIMTLLRLYS
jgi:RNA polymerase sigma-70 factor (ECF subfamily)